MQQVASFYQSHKLPIYYHVSDASPPGLDAKLDQLGFQIDAPSVVMTAPSKKVLKLSKLKWNEKWDEKVKIELTPR